MFLKQCSIAGEHSALWIIVLRRLKRKLSPKELRVCKIKVTYQVIAEVRQYFFGKILQICLNLDWPPPPERNFTERVFDIFIIIFLLTLSWVFWGLGKINDIIFGPMVRFLKQFEIQKHPKKRHRPPPPSHHGSDPTGKLCTW